MALNKQPVAINFAQGVDTKSDPWQIPVGKFFNLVNSVFTKQGLLTKRNGFGELPVLPEPASYLTTFSTDLVAIGNVLQSYIAGVGTWYNAGDTPQVSLSVLSIARANQPII